MHKVYKCRNLVHLNLCNLKYLFSNQPPMKFLLLLLTAAIFSSGESAAPLISLRNSLQTGCSPDPAPEDIIETVNVKEGAILLMSRKVRIKLPSAGLYPTAIKCVMLNDNTQSSNSATISGGGIGQKYVEIELKSTLSKGLDYRIEIVRAAG